MTDIITRYTQGDCGLLAAEISKLTGWPTVLYIGERGNHMLVRCPDGRLLDIMGLHHPAEFPGARHLDGGPPCWWPTYTEDTPERVHADAVALLAALAITAALDHSRLKLRKEGAL